MLSSAYLIGFYCFFKSILSSLFFFRTINQWKQLWRSIGRGKKEEDEEEEKFVPPGKYIEKLSNHSKKKRSRRWRNTRRLWKENLFNIDDLLFQFIMIVIIIISCLWIDKFFHIQIECFTIEKSKWSREEHVDDDACMHSIRFLRIVLIDHGYTCRLSCQTWFHSIFF